MKKVLHVFVGTDYAMMSPSHPLNCAKAAKDMVDRIMKLPESKYEVRTNSEIAVRIFDVYASHKGIGIEYYINGHSATFKEVLADFATARTYLDNLIHLIQFEV